LSNEIYYEIFDYLDGCTIHKAFSKLNRRFRQLIKSELLIFKIAFNNKSNLDIKYCCEHVIIPNKYRVTSIHLWNTIFAKGFFMHCVIDSSFNCLESVVLHSILPSEPVAMLSPLKSLPRLFKLTIHFYKYDHSYINLRDMYFLIFQLPYLKYNSLSLSIQVPYTNLLSPPSNACFNMIECLYIGYGYTLYGLMSILYYTPKLRRLSCTKLIQSNVNDEPEI
jgi:hypothetical protein